MTGQQYFLYNMSDTFKHEEQSGGGQYELILDGTTKKINKKSRNRASSSWYYVGFATDLGFTIALPIVGGAILGKYLDGAWGTYPKATLSLLLLGIVISVVGFVGTIREILKKK